MMIPRAFVQSACCTYSPFVDGTRDLEYIYYFVMDPKQRPYEEKNFGLSLVLNILFVNRMLSVPRTHNLTGFTSHFFGSLTSCIVCKRPINYIRASWFSPVIFSSLCSLKNSSLNCPYVNVLRNILKNFAPG